MTSDFVRYPPEIETIDPDIDDRLAQIIEFWEKKGRESPVTEGTGRAVRRAHAKAIGVVKAEVEILHDVPAAYAQGTYGKPARHGALIRFSSAANHLGPDAQLGPLLGFAIKIFDVEGPKLVEDEPNCTTFDLVLKNNPTFIANTAKHYLFHPGDRQRQRQVPCSRHDRVPRALDGPSHGQGHARAAGRGLRDAGLRRELRLSRVTGRPLDVSARADVRISVRRRARALRAIAAGGDALIPAPIPLRPGERAAARHVQRRPAGARRSMRAAWASFAANGAPSAWPPFNRGERVLSLVPPQPQVWKGFADAHHCDFRSHW